MYRFRTVMVSLSLVALSLSVAGVSEASTAKTVKHTAPKYVYGMSTYVQNTCQDPTTWATYATNQVAAFKALGVTSIGLSFPFYTDGVSSNNIYTRNTCSASYASPSPDQLAVIVTAAHAAGLSVFLRPTLDQANLKAQSILYWHGNITPSNPSTWFANYLTMMTPYLKMAQTNHVESFAIASELSSMNKNSLWSSLISSAKKLYKGSVVFTASWASNGNPVVWPGTALGLDTYRPVAAATGSWSPAQLLAGWDTTLKSIPIKLPSTVTIDEVGIMAQSGGYQGPNGSDLPLDGHPFSQLVQVNWFTMACHFMKEHAMKGIYFWGPWLTSNDGNLPSSPDMVALTNIQPLTQTAIKNCFGVGTKPGLSALSPGSVLAKGGSTVTANGTSFTGVFNVTVGGAPVKFTYVSNNQITFVAPKHAKGKVSVVVTTEAGSTSKMLTFK